MNRFDGIARGLFVTAVLSLALTGAARASTTFEERLDLGPGGSFELRADLGKVTLRGGDSDGVVVVVTSSKDDIRERLEWTFESDGSMARVRARRPASERGLWGWMSGSSGYRLEFDITVPTETAVTIDTSGGSIEVEHLRGKLQTDTSGGKIRIRDVEGEVLADTSGGSIAVEDIVGNVRLDTSGGGITAEGVDGDVDADTSGGSIRLAAIRGDARADTSGGGITIEGVGGRVEADTSGGSISVAFSPGNASGGVLSTSGGGIHVAVDPAAALDIDAECSGGSVRSDVPVTIEGKLERGQLRGRMNGGGATLRLRGSGGGIEIESL